MSKKLELCYGFQGHWDHLDPRKPRKPAQMIRGGASFFEELLVTDPLAHLSKTPRGKET